MNLARTEKRLREARFFLEKMRDPGDRESFEFYLSAFLGAARAVDRQLRDEQWAIYPRWREAWDSRLLDSERGLMKFMTEAPDVEEKSTITGQRPTRSRPRYWFTIDGGAREATEACAQYLELLTSMAEAFKGLP